MDSSDSSVYTSDNDSDDTAQSVLRDFRRRTSNVSTQQQRVIRLERRVRRQLSTAVFEERSLNLDTLFGGPARGVQQYDVDERARIQLERHRRRRYYAFEYNLPDALYNLDVLSVDWADARQIGVPQGDFRAPSERVWQIPISRPFGQRFSPVQQLANELEDHLVGAVGGESEESDWDNFAPSAPIVPPPYRAATQQRFPQSSLRTCLRGARTDIKRCLLLCILDIKRANPGVNPESAWTLLVERLRREEAITQEHEADALWQTAFGEPRGELLQRIITSSTQEVIALWYVL